MKNDDDDDIPIYTMSLSMQGYFEVKEEKKTIRTFAEHIDFENQLTKMP